MKVEHIQHHKDTIAVILYNRPIELGVHFYAKDEHDLQVVTIYVPDRRDWINYRRRRRRRQ